MQNFWDYSVWGWVLLFGVLFGALLLGNIIRRKISFLKDSLIPTSVLGGCLLLVISGIYKVVTGREWQRLKL